MKKILLIFLAAVVAILLGIGVFMLSILFVFNDDWVLREKVYPVTIPITNSDDLNSIEKQTKTEAKKHYENAYLGRVFWKSSSKQEFDDLHGTVIFRYYAYLGKQWGFEPIGKQEREKYAICEVTVDLSQNVIIEVRIYGNDQLGGGEEITDFDNKTIYAILYNDTQFKKLLETYNDFGVNITMYSHKKYLTFGFTASDGRRKVVSGGIGYGYVYLEQ